MIKFYEQCSWEIRQYDTHHILIYEGNQYARDFTMFTENLDENSAYSFHYYPFLQLPAEKKSGENQKQLINQKLKSDVSLEHLLNLGKPIWCGETGHLARHPLSYMVLVEFLQVLNSYHISWALWPYKDIGDMGIVCPNEKSEWGKLSNQLTNHWDFWKVFTQDSLIAAQKNENKYLYYQQLAYETTKAHKLFAANLQTSHTESFTESIEDFSFDKTIVNKHYKDILPKIIG
ncbi:hypothetical protein ES703_108821 [subsurface metagenome]